MHLPLFSAPCMTGRRSHWTEQGDDNIFFTFGHCGALVPSLAANGLIVVGPSCENSLYPSAEESWEEMTKVEPRNNMLYSPGSDQVTWSSGHLGRRFSYNPPPLELWPGSSPTDPQTPKNSKTRKSDSKVTFGVPVKVTQKLLKSDFFRPFLTLLSYFWVTFESLSPEPRKSLLSHFFASLNFSGFGGL